MKVLFYGRLAEAIGPELELRGMPDCCVADVRDRLLAEHPHMTDVLRSRHARTCVGDRLVSDDYRLAAGDTIEFLPPVSGG